MEAGNSSDRGIREREQEGATVREGGREPQRERERERETNAAEEMRIRKLFD